MARRTLRRLLGLDAAAPRGPAWSVLVYAANLPEAELLAQLVHQQGIPVFFRRPLGQDVPDFLAAGQRVLLVPAERLAEARELLLSLEAADEAPPSTMG
jgi:hypothetical protein